MSLDEAKEKLAQAETRVDKWARLASLMFQKLADSPHTVVILVLLMIAAIAVYFLFS